jgi:amino acid adenylation domain-containing protein
MTENDHMNTGLEIAVIGMAGRFTGARDIAGFWDNLKYGVETISFFSTQELEEAGVSTQSVNSPNYVKACGMLEGCDTFDASFFGYTPTEAEVMDPQTRVFHECVWTALEDAGYDTMAYEGLIGLYAGASANTEWEARTLLSGKGDGIGAFETGQLIRNDFLSLRISYTLDLKGPAFSMYTACSTSLAAVHVACQAILNGECDMALAGGVTVSHLTKRGYFFQEGMIASPDGHCRAFDASARGTVGADGAGVVVLKRLEDAVADNDHIYAVVKGSAMNNDGLRKAGFTAPSVEGQAEVIRMALQMAEVEPESIAYIETHGTGTNLGDPVEMEALKRVFQDNKKHSCAIGSVKSNIGHADSAAGIAGFIKTVLALHHRLIPPSLHFESPNPAIDFQHSPFFVNTGSISWAHRSYRADSSNRTYPLRAGVSSFGIGGTNVHVVLEEKDKRYSPPHSTDLHLLLLSAKTPSALDKMRANLARHFRDYPDVSPADAAFTLQTGRRHFPYRWMAACSNIQDAIAALSSGNSRKSRTFHNDVNGFRPVLFMFPGLGAQYENMGQELCRAEPLFRQEMDHCFETLKSIMGYNIKEIIYPEVNVGAIHELPPGPPPITRHSSLFTEQILTFIFQYSLAALLMHWGIVPQAMIGYSFGEYAAACVSGVFSLEDALKVIVTRAQAVETLREGEMLSVPLPVEQVQPLLPAGLDIAVDNGSSCVVAGPTEEVLTFGGVMKEKKYLCMRLNASRAFHSQMMVLVLEEVKEHAAGISLKAPQIPYISNVTGKWLTVSEAGDPGYWSRHLRGTVRFADGIRELLRQQDNDHAVLVELGPGRDLSALVMRFLDNNSRQKVIHLTSPMNKTITESGYLKDRLGQLWLWGVNIPWQRFYREQKPQRVPLPTYPFERQHFGIGTDPFNLDKGQIRETLLPGKTISTAVSPGLCYVPSWKRSLPNLHIRTDDRETFRWLLFVNANRHHVQERLVQRLTELQQEVIEVKEGSEFKEIKEDAVHRLCTFTLNPRDRLHYDRLFDRLDAEGLLPHYIILCWDIDQDINTNDRSVDEFLHYGFITVLYIAQALGKRNFNGTRFVYLSNHLFDVIGSEPLCPAKATVPALLNVLPQEYPGLDCCCVDIEVPEPGEPGEIDRLIDTLIKECSGSSTDRLAAYRNSRRWVQVFEPLLLEIEPGGQLPVLRDRGVYLVTGGLGTIGLIAAELLIKETGARVVLTGRSPFPSRDEWDTWLETHPETDPVSLKIGKLRELEEMGGAVLYIKADVANLQQMRSVVEGAEESFGTINGVIHAAGIVENRSIKPLRELATDDCMNQFRAKVHGTLVLAELFKNRELDFCWLISSISTVLGGLGLGAYAAANAFMDAFVLQHNRGSSGFHWFSLDWDGMAADNTAALFRQFFYLEGIDRLVVSSGGELQARIDRWVKLESLHEMQTPGMEADKENRFPRPQLSVEYVAPRTVVEQEIVRVWQNLLGIIRIGVQDDFLELGGDSLKAITAISLLHRRLNVNIPIAGFFKHPTAESIAVFIESMENKDRFTSLEPAETLEYYRLSSAQERLYILYRLGMDNLSYNVPQVLELQGTLDKERLEETFKQLIRRHDSFRTSFMEVDDEPVQRVHDEVEFEIEMHKLQKTGSSPGVKECVRDFIRPFDFSKAPLLRVGLIETGNPGNTFILMLDMHHIISDLVSSDIFVKDFFRLYAGEPLAPLRLQYKDFSQWQNTGKGGERIKKQETYWLRQMEGDLPVLDLPADFPRPAVQSHEGAAAAIKLTPEETNALNEMARMHKSTLFMVLLTAFYTLLSRLSNREDIIVGTPVVGRRHADLDKIIGIFINVLAMRGFPAAEKSFTSFLAETRDITLAAFDNQDYPFEDLVERKSVKRDMSRNPVFNVLFSWQDSFTSRERTPGIEKEDLRINPYEYESNASQFDLSLAAFTVADTLHLSFQYCIKLFKPTTVSRFITYFKNIISGVLHDPGVKLAEIDIMSPEEKKQVLNEFNDTAAEYSEDKPLHILFEEQTQRTPDRIAVTGRVGAQHVAPTHVSITYRELNNQSDKLAVSLRDNGIKPDTIVAIRIERSIELIIGLLGILKARGAYLPIDPAYPQERVDYMLKDSNARGLVGWLEGLKVRWFDGSNLPTYQPINQLIDKPDNLAYVIYTSGSTGKPKGAMLEHRNLVNLVRFIHNSTNIDTSRVLQFCTISFDMSFTEIFPTLLCGGTLFLIDEETRKNIRALFKCIEQNDIKTLHLPTSFLKFIAGEADYMELFPPNVDHITSGGEQLVVNNRLRRHLLEHNVCLHNHYGPSETHVVTALTLDVEEDLSELPSIGKPILNTSIYIMSKAMQLAPVGVPGELVIGGTQVGRGYLNNAELTAEKFVSSPFTPHPSPLYKTGDLARWLPDGCIEFLGRIDRQLKIRGYRVEPGEIESSLTAHEDIKDAAVIAKDINNEKKLCAYIVPQREFNVSELREYLSRHLPDWMLPSYFVQMEKIPLTVNGKVDRNALPEPGVKTVEEYTAPRNEAEEKLAGLWSQVLGIEKEVIAITSNFFELGGNSLQLIKLVSKIFYEFGIEIDINHLFETPTIIGIAKDLDSRKYIDEPVVFLNTDGPAVQTIFCFPSSIGFGLNYSRFASFLPDYAFYAFHFIDDPERLNRYVEMISQFQAEGPYILFGWSAAGRLIFQVGHELEVRGFRVSDIILMDSFFIPDEEDEPGRSQKGRELYFREIEKHLQSLGLEFLKEKVLSKSGKYLDYFTNVKQLDVLDADVHLILSTEKREPELLQSWNKYTTKTTRIYQGYGGHREMFSEAHVEKNAEVFKRLLAANCAKGHE